MNPAVLVRADRIVRRHRWRIAAGAALRISLAVSIVALYLAAAAVMVAWVIEQIA